MKNMKNKKLIIAFAIIEALVLIPAVIYVIFYK